MECQGERPGTVCPRVDLASTRDIHNAGVRKRERAGGRKMYVVIYIYGCGRGKSRRIGAVDTA